jgi:cysteine desulfurase
LNHPLALCEGDKKMRFANGDIYLDYNATTPVDSTVFQNMRPYYETWFGNPSSGHAQGLATRTAIVKAREQVAKLLGCDSDEIIFTSSGSESNNMIIKGQAIQQAGRGRHIIISAIEHPAVTKVTNYLTKHGFRISLLPVNGQGLVSAADLDEIITSKTILVSVMHANNEVGAIQPIRELSDIAHSYGALFHTDAAQSAGKIPTLVHELGCDALSMAGHKLYAPKGIGVLYLKRGTKIEPLIHGAPHENGLRAGTENVSQIVGMGAAAHLASMTIQQEQERIGGLRDRLQAQLKSAFPEIRINSKSVDRLPNTLSMSFPGLNALEIMNAMPELMVSAGAACHSGDGKGSGVLEAMSVPLNYQLGTLRLSLGRYSDAAQVEEVVQIFTTAINNLKNK